MANETDCLTIAWSSQAIRVVTPLFYLCTLATLTHLFFWLQFIAYPAVRQRSMQWLYAYLTTDVLLLARFFLSYVYRRWPLCLSALPRLVLCYGEAIFDNYLNLLQSYILLALNVCRYMQIVHNLNVYALHGRAMVLVHVLIYSLPLAGHLLLIRCGWSELQSPTGDACDLLPVSLAIRLVFLLFSYVIPVTSALVFLLLSLNHVRNTEGIQSRVIVDARLKYHRQLVIQSCVFYSLWLLLWSPHLLVFPFYYKNSRVGVVAQVMNYLSITVDPVVIAALDVRFMYALRWSGDHFDRQIRRGRSVRVPVIMFSGPSDEAMGERSSNTT